MDHWAFWLNPIDCTFGRLALGPPWHLSSMSIFLIFAWAPGGICNALYLPSGRVTSMLCTTQVLVVKFRTYPHQGGVEVCYGMVWYGMIWYVPSKHLSSSVVHTIIRVGRKLPSLGNISNPDNLSSGEILPKSKFLSNQLSHCILSPNTWWFHKTCITGIWCHYLHWVDI